MNETHGEQRKGAAELKVRVMAAAALIPAVLLLTWAGAAPFALMVGALSVLMAREWAGFVHGGDGRQFLLLAVAGVSGALGGAGAMPVAFAWLVVTAVWFASLLLTFWDKRGFTLFHLSGAPYMALPAFALTALRAGPERGLTAVLFLFAVVWSADTAAYFAGRAIGGPKFAPRISPNKTWAGFGGAVAGGAAAGLCVAVFAGLSLWALLLLGGFLGGVEQLGDLFESAAKRRFGVKDSGGLIPGHGGVLDRVDGLAAAAVAALAVGWLHGGAQPAAGLLAW